MTIQNIYKAITWEALRLFDQQEIPFNFIPAISYKTKAEQIKAFEGDHFDRTRFTLTWLFEQLKKSHIVQDQSVFDFAEQLQYLLPGIKDERFEVIQNGRNFNYPPFPFQIDNFSLDTKLMSKEADKQRVRIWKSKLRKFKTFKLHKDEDDGTNDYHIVHRESHD